MKQVDAAKILGVTPRTLRDWTTEWAARPLAGAPSFEKGENGKYEFNEEQVSHFRKHFTGRKRGRKPKGTASDSIQANADGQEPDALELPELVVAPPDIETPASSGITPDDAANSSEAIETPSGDSVKPEEKEDENGQNERDNRGEYITGSW